jgi:hypothetical protein
MNCRARLIGLHRRSQRRSPTPIFGFIWLVLKMAFAAFLGVVLYGSGWLFFQSVSLMH